MLSPILKPILNTERLIFTRSTASAARCRCSRSSVRRGRRPIAGGRYGHVTFFLRATAPAPSADNSPPEISAKIFELLTAASLI